MKNDNIFVRGENMELRLISLKLSGIKSIEKEIEISFLKKNFNDNVFTNSYVKTIYGPNGSGKTGIVNAFEIYKHLITSDFPFISNSYNSFLPNMINKKTKTFLFDVIFAIKKDKKTQRINHLIEIRQAEDGKYYFSREMINTLNSRLGKKETLFEALNGDVIANEAEYKIGSIDPMILKNNSFVKLFCTKVFGDKEHENDSLNDIELSIVSVMTFALSLFIAYGDKQDKHTGHFLEWAVKNAKNNHVEYASEYINNQLRSGLLTSYGGNYFDIVFKTNNSLKDYKKNIKKMESFIKLLKQDLLMIDVREKIVGDMYLINLVFIYDNCEVEYEYESTGVKKLCMLFSAFMAAKHGKITIIDEIDANIHDTFLTKLFQYFVTYSEAQIICTTHNVEIMSITSSRSKSIDFLSDDNRIIPWIKTGRLSPAVLYLKGRIPFIPFNLDSSEFAEVFANE